MWTPLRRGARSDSGRLSSWSRFSEQAIALTCGFFDDRHLVLDHLEGLLQNHLFIEAEALEHTHLDHRAIRGKFNRLCRSTKAAVEQHTSGSDAHVPRHARSFAGLGQNA